MRRREVIGLLGSTAAVAWPVNSSPVENAAQIKQAIERCADMSNCGLLLPPDSTTMLHRDLIITMANQHRLAAVYPFRIFVSLGGLMSYSTDQVDLFDRPLLCGSYPAG